LRIHLHFTSLTKAAILTMHKRMTRSWGLTLLLFTLLFGSTAGAVQAATDTARPGDALRAQIAAWAKGLAGEPGFRAFADASIEVTPLGPGTHGWLALLKEPGKPNAAGYMIVHAVPSGGYQLSEYGLGEYYPFAQQTLREGLARIGLVEHGKQPLRLERLYPNAMLAAWRITLPGIDAPAVYLDAKTGEELPIDDVAWQAQLSALQKDPAHMPTAAVPPRQVVSSVSGTSFDPYARMPWLTRQPIELESASMLADKLKEGAELRLAFEWFDGGYLHILPVAAVHAWDDGTAYVAADQEGLRFLPYATVVKPYGSLYD